jgi:hypothetical protein
MRVETIIEQMLFATLRIETVTPTGISCGTGFIFAYEHNQQSYLFIITNKHVIANAARGSFFFTLADGLNPLIGQKHSIVSDNFQSLWYGHPDSDIDIAVCPLAPILNQLQLEGVTPFFKAIPHTLIPDEK